MKTASAEIVLSDADRKALQRVTGMKTSDFSAGVEVVP